MKKVWLDRRLVELPYYFRLCVTEKDFNAELKRMKIHPIPFLATPFADATCHFLENSNGKNCVIVCIGNHNKRTLVEIYGLLIHEAVHIWQGACELIGEHSPGKETEAYAIQSIAQELIASYNEQMGIKIGRPRFLV